jgi:hypothetical protein
MTNPMGRSPTKDTSKMTPAERKVWAEEHAGGVANGDKHPFYIAPFSWRNFHSSWQDKYWELIYKRGSYVAEIRELNLKLTARVMELEHTLNMLQQPQGLAASKWVRHE